MFSLLKRSVKTSVPLLTQTRFEKRKYSDDTQLLLSSVVFVSILTVNVINIPQADLDVKTTKLVAFSVLKAWIYALASPFSLFGIALTWNRLEDHGIPASVYFKHLRGVVSEEKPKKE